MHAERGALLFALSFVLLSPQAGAQRLIATVTVGTTPVALALDPATNKIFAVNRGSNNVTVIDGAHNRIAAVVTVGQSPSAVAANWETNKIYVANSGGNTVTVIDGTTYSTVSVADGTSPRGVAVDPVTNKIYVINYNSNNVTVIDGSNNSILATVPVGVHPQAVAINPVTNKIYVANMGDGSVTVIDGVTNHPTGVYTGGGDPYAVAVNSETNTIYVANLGGTVSVIDGATNWFINVPVGRYPDAVAVNPVSNLIYVTNYGDGTVSVIDGAHNTIVATVVVGDGPGSIAVDPVTNAIYVANSVTGTVSAFNGVDRLVTTVPVRSSPYAVVLNPTTNRVYVANSGDGTVSVIAGLNSDPLQFIPVTPCRLYDTRPQYGGGGPILGGTFQSFPIQGMDSCGDVIPAPPLAYSLNVTIVPAGPLGYLTVWPSGEDRPALSTLNSPDGQVKASAAIVPAGAGAAISVYASNTTNVLLDINGYFTAVSKSTLAFYPLTPCRVADTRWANGPLGGPLLQGGAPGRDFPVTSSGCRIPASAQAYSLNFTAVPKGPLDHLTAWAAGQEQPGVFTLSAMTGLVTSNSAIVQAGGGGDIQVFVSDDSHVIIDINGYFGPAAPGGLSLNGTAPCRMLDTRNTTGAFSERIGVSKVFTCRWGI